MAGEQGEPGWVGQLAHEIFQGMLQFYDKSPIIASIGFLLVLGSVPLAVLLAFAFYVKKADNKLVVDKMKTELQFSKASSAAQQDAATEA